LEVLEGYRESWEDMRADSQSNYRPTHRDIQLIIRDFDVYLLMDWTCDRILKEAPRLFKGLEGITVVVDHEDTRNRRITHAVSVEPAKLLVSEIDSAFNPSQSKKQETQPSRPAVDIRSRSDFRKVLIVSEYPEETREAVNRWYNNFHMDGFAQPNGRSSGVPYVYLDTGVSVSDAVAGSNDSVAWTACHDVRYIEKIRDIVDCSAGRVYDWPEGASDVYEALEASHLRD
jgi:hypothetical protein